MALSKTISKNIYGKTIDFENTYIKIGQLTGSKEQLEFETLTFAEDMTNLISIQTHVFKPSVLENSENFIKQGYEYLKTLDEYKDALDILEE